MPKAPEYTQCVKPKDFSPESLLEAIGNGLVVGGIYAVINAMATQGFSILAGGIAAFLVLATALMTFVHWWLYGRLICLGGERCVIGLVVSVEPPQAKSGVEIFDTDYSFNLLLAPHHIGVTRATLEADGFMGPLVGEQQATKAKQLLFNGYTSVGKGCQDKRTEVLHCEIEGSGMQTLYDTLKVIVALLTVASVASFFCAVPVIGWIACLVAAGFLAAAILAALVGLAIAKDDAAKPSDVNPALGGSLRWGCGGHGSDVLVVVGEWVYDSQQIGHSSPGWNELHPVRHCQKIGGPWAGMWPPNVRDAANRWCGSISATRSPLTQSNQDKPEHQWTIHPLIDGCGPRDGDHRGPRDR